MRTTASTILLGVAGSIGTGTAISEKQLSEHPEIDLILKIMIPVLTGVLIPFLNDLREEYRINRRIKRERENKAYNDRNNE